MGLQNTFLNENICTALTVIKGLRACTLNYKMKKKVFLSGEEPMIKHAAKQHATFSARISRVVFRYAFSTFRCRP